MPEGPTIVLAKNAMQPLFEGEKIIAVNGSAPIDMALLKNKVVTSFKSWGKHFLICTKDATVRIHFLMFGSYTINEKKDRKPKLHLQFKNGELNFYTCSVKMLEGKPDEIYDWSADVLNNNWDPKKAKQKLKENGNMLVCDALLDQEIFAGVGNIIKNEVLFRIKLHPKSSVNQLPPKMLNALVKEASNYSYDFLKWKQTNELKKHWLAYTKKICPRCNIALHKEHLGNNKRRTFFCNNCQVLY